MRSYGSLVVTKKKRGKKFAAVIEGKHRWIQSAAMFSRTIGAEGGQEHSYDYYLSKPDLPMIPMLPVQIGGG